MHKAVTARLDDPNLTLYEALKIGGFDYPTNDDASLIDSEKVTLGQRKNQLSRRLRLARKQDTDSLGGSTANGNFYRNDAYRNDTYSVDTNGERKGPHSTLGARALQMKRDYDLTLDEGGLAAANAANSISELMDEQAKRPRIAKHHPDFAPLIVPPTSSRGSSSFDPAAMNVTSPSFGSRLVSSVGVSGIGSGPYFNPHYASAYSGQQQQHPRASAVAVSSLTSSAQAVGLTLEQLALALSSNATNLAKLVAETKSGESMHKQQELAMNLFATESKALYTKCMIMSGIDMSLAQPGTPTFMAFALKAWQAEGKRLQDMMSSAERESANMDASELFAADNAGAFKSSPAGAGAGEDTSHNEERAQSSEGRSRTHDYNQQQQEDQDDHQGCDAQHFHVLGQCGHKAIIHAPKDGVAHVDFVVNDQVECYMGLDSVPFGRNVDSAWPSKTKCREVQDTCPKSCSKSVLDSVDVGENGQFTEPKIFKLSEIDLQGSEWNFDAGESVDGGVLGLFKLGGDVSMG